MTRDSVPPSPPPGPFSDELDPSAARERLLSALERIAGDASEHRNERAAVLQRLRERCGELGRAVDTLAEVEAVRADDLERQAASVRAELDAAMKTLLERLDEAGRGATEHARRAEEALGKLASSDERFAALEHRLEQLGYERDVAATRAKEQERGLEEARRSAAELGADRDKLSAELAKAVESITDLGLQQAALSEASAAAIQARDDALAEVKRLRASRDALRVDVQRTSTEHKAEQETLRRKVAEQTASITRLVAERDAAAAALEDEKRTARQHRVSLEEQHESFVADLEQQTEERIAKLERERDDATFEAAAANKALEEARTSVRRADEERAARELERERESAERERERLERESERVEWERQSAQRLEALEGAAAQLRTELGQAAERARGADSERDAARAELARLEAAGRESVTEIEQLAGEVEAASEGLAAAVAERDEAVRARAEAQQERARAVDQLRVVETERDNAVSGTQTAVEERDALKAALRDAAAELDGAKAEIVRLATERDQAVESAERLGKELEATWAGAASARERATPRETPAVSARTVRELEPAPGRAGKGQAARGAQQPPDRSAGSYSIGGDEIEPEVVETPLARRARGTSGRSGPPSRRSERPRRRG
jgi:chromosome segregation ATPase